MTATHDIERPAGATHRKHLAICALAIAGLALLLIMIGGIGQNLVYYWGPTELRAAGTQAYGATIRLGGLVAPRSVRYANGSSLLEFDVTDATTVVHVRSTGTAPQMFREGIGVVVEGTMTPRNYFESTRLMVKHGNDYKVPKDGRPVDAAILMRSTEGLQSEGETMTPLIGRLLILGALGAAVQRSIFGFASMKAPNGVGAAWARRGALAFALLMIAANLVMVWALVTTDFSVLYVTQVGSRSLPLWVQIVSLWSSLEGSILFWGMVLGLYIAGATLTMTRRHRAYGPAAIGVWLACGAFFAFLIAGPAQPFATIASPPLDGPGPNPLLQNHILMAIHPPFLYLGYVGMTIPFGIASAALLSGRLDREVLDALRTWLLIPWTFQTVAIVLGGWWAYEVLGWGGYWSWDPVENASFLPWLTATSALHSLVVTERKGTLKGWTATLVMSTFLLTILGTFMTRSGVFNSVHSFTQSAIGPAILSFLAIALIWTIVLLAARIDTLESRRDVGPAASREGAFLINNLLFVLFTLTVLVGTVFPLIVEALTDRQITVGRPYFDAMGVPIGMALLFLLGVGPALPWGRTTGRDLRDTLVPPLIGAAVFSVVGWIFQVRNPWTIVTIAFGGYAAQVTLGQLWRLRQGRRRVGSYIVHAGVVIVVIAVAVSNTMQFSRELHLGRGETAAIGPYTLTFLGASAVTEVNRESIVADIRVDRAGTRVGSLKPRMNFYPMSQEPIGTPAVRTTVGSDLYVSILNIGTMGQEITLHALINPMVAWIWIATLVMAVGGVVSMMPSRRPVTGIAASGLPLGATPRQPPAGEHA